MHDGVKTRGLNDDLKRWQMRVAHTCAAQKKQRTGNARLLSSTTYSYWKVLAKRWWLIKNLKKTNKTTTEEPGSARSKSCVDITEASELKERWMQRSLCFCLKFTCTVGLLGLMNNSNMLFQVTLLFVPQLSKQTNKTTSFNCVLSVPPYLHHNTVCMHSLVKGIITFFTSYWHLQSVMSQQTN